MKNLNSAFVKLVLLVASIASMTSAAGAAVIPGKYFNRVIIVVFENTNYGDALKQPFFFQLASGGANFSNFIAEAHPSQANYVALTAGTMGPVKGDGKYDLDLTNVIDLLEGHGISWKIYAEDYPGGCDVTMNSGSYYRKHNPFISFKDIQVNSLRCSKIVDEKAFDDDRLAGTLPQYVFYVPNSQNDGHDTGVAFADRWYKGKFGAVIQDLNLMKDTILMSTFDESERNGKNMIYTSIYGDAVKAASYNDAVNHYSLLRLVEDNWGLGGLGRKDDRATLIPSIWK